GKPGGNRGRRVHRRGRPASDRGFRTIDLARHYRRLHSAQLLAGVVWGQVSFPDSKTSAARWVYPPRLPRTSCARPVLALRSLLETIRHVRNASRLSALRNCLPDNPMLRLREFAANE